MKMKDFNINDIDFGEISKENEGFENELMSLLERYGIAQHTIFKMVSVKELNGKDFYVRDYQRGYRWTKTEIEDLLSDIEEINGDKYCMQPLTIRKIDAGQLYSRCLSDSGIELCTETATTTEQAYELIDGQQRLTTISLILQWLKCQKTKYTIFYELLRKIDDYYLEQAVETIKEWFDSKGKDTEYKEKFLEKILSNVFFIWYEESGVDTQKKVEDLFQNINAGKVALTNAELFRAILLNVDNAKLNDGSFNNIIVNKIFQIAFEWDKLEQALQDNEFWFFISNKDCEEKTRIDYLLELYARDVVVSYKALGKNDVKKKQAEGLKAYFEALKIVDERFSFNAIKKYVDYRTNELKEDKFLVVCDVWEKIVEIYERLYSWFKDYELYHYVGFFAAIEHDKKKKTFTSDKIFELFQESKQSTIAKLKEKIKKQLFDYFYDTKTGRLRLDKNDGSIENVEYKDKEAVTACLLFFNIYTTMQNDKTKNRFPFHLYKLNAGERAVWNIEHVNPQNLDDSLEKVEKDIDRANYVLYMHRFFENSEDLSEPNGYNQEFWDEVNKVSSGQLSGFDEKCGKAVEKYWNDGASKYSDEENKIENLVLLDEQTNKSYGNAFFEYKREEIIKRDSSSTFIPPATKNVFLKYYSTPKNYIVWDDNDKKAYLSALKKCFEKIKGWGK